MYMGTLGTLGLNFNLHGGLAVSITVILGMIHSTQVVRKHYHLHWFTLEPLYITFWYNISKCQTLSEGRTIKCTTAF